MRFFTKILGNLHTKYDNMFLAKMRQRINYLKGEAKDGADYQAAV